MASYDEYYKRFSEQGVADLDKIAEERRKADEETKAQIGSYIDSATANKTKTYQDEIDKAPETYQPQYDANAVQEAVGRKRLQEGMANMGLTDSGLNRSQQTALTVARGNADAATRQAQDEFVSKLMKAIDDAVAEGESQKAEQNIAIDSARNDWYNAAKTSVIGNAQSAASSAYAADQDTAARIEAARIEAAEKEADRRAAAAEKEKDRQAAAKEKEADRKAAAADDNSQQRFVYQKYLMDNGLATTEADAFNIAAARYPTGNANADTYYVTYSYARGSGFGEGYADAFATATVNGTDPGAAVMTFAKKTVADNKDEINGWVKSGWNIKKTAEKARTAVEDSSLAGDDIGSAYAVGYVVGQRIKDHVKVGSNGNVGKLYKEIEEEFGYNADGTPTIEMQAVLDTVPALRNYRTGK